MSAFSADDIVALSFDTSMDIASQVPNLQFKSEFGVTTPTIFIRGLGNEAFFSNAIAPVSLYNDGVYVGQNIAQGFQLFDLERVEVLRGPQGTLFGRNTTGGLVNYVSRKPDISEPLNGRIALTVGSHGQVDVDGAVGAPLGKTVAARLAVFRQQNDGYFDNVNPALSNEDEGEVEAISARGQLAWEPTDNIRFLLNLHGSDSDSQMRAYKPSYLDCPPGVPPGSFQSGCTGPFGLSLTDSPGFRDTQLTFPTIEDVEAYGVAFEANIDIGNYTLTSIIAFDTAEMTRFEDDDGNVLAILSDTFLADTDYWSQEYRVTSNYSGPTNWVAGVNYYVDELETFVSFNQRDIPIPFFNGTGLAQELSQDTHSWAVFGEINHRFWDKFRATLGLRVTHDERSGTVETFVYNAGAVPEIFIPVAPATTPLTPQVARSALLVPLILPAGREQDWLEWSGRAALSYELAEDHLVYASASRGFKGGEFNGGALVTAGEVTITDPEFTDNFELGYKGTHLDGRLQFNVTAFLMQIDDQIVQINNPVPGGAIPLLANVASAESKGFEFELKYQATERWFLSLGGGYLDAEFEEFLDPGTGLDRSGNRLAESPEWTFNGIVRYIQPIPQGDLSVQADWQWNDDRFFSVENDPALREDAYGLVNLRVSYLMDKYNLEFAFIVRNLLDEDYLLSGFDAQTAGGNNIFLPGDPRTFSGQITFRF